MHTFNVRPGDRLEGFWDVENVRPWARPYSYGFTHVLLVSVMWYGSGREYGVIEWNANSGAYSRSVYSASMADAIATYKNYEKIKDKKAGV